MKNLRRLACKFDLNQSERKSTQVHASPGQTESQVDPSSQLAATCDSVWPGLKFHCLKCQEMRFVAFQFSRIFRGGPGPP